MNHNLYKALLNNTIYSQKSSKYHIEDQGPLYYKIQYTIHINGFV